MMFNNMAQMIYGYIVKSELVFLRMYKVNPFEIMNHISLLDLNTYMNAIQQEEKKQREGMTKTKIMDCLKGVSDYLNLIFYKK